MGDGPGGWRQFPRPILADIQDFVVEFAERGDVADAEQRRLGGDQRLVQPDGSLRPQGVGHAVQDGERGLGDQQAGDGELLALSGRECVGPVLLGVQAPRAGPSAPSSSARCRASRILCLGGPGGELVAEAARGGRRGSRAGT